MANIDEKIGKRVGRRRAGDPMVVAPGDRARKREWQGADAKKKHAAHAITLDVSLAETVKAAEVFRADAVIVTGESGGRGLRKQGFPASRGDGIT